jgi:Rrf2 family protein
MRITLESDYALRILASMAEYDGVTDAKTISSDTSVTLRFTLKILHKLVQGGVVESFKGTRGGYKLKEPAESVSLKRVIELIDGPIAISRCVESKEGCSLNYDKTACKLHHIFDGVSIDLAKKLDAITIKDLLS